MSLFAPPEPIKTAVFADVPARLRKKGTPPERLAAGKSETRAGCFLEGPAFDRAGNLWVVDLAFGRILFFTKEGKCEVFAEYEGEPNGIAIHRDGRIFVADHKLGIIFFDAKNPKITPVVSRYHQQGFKGVNDLFFDLQGNLYFTDQGTSDLADPTGCVYRWTKDGVLQQLANCIPSPNGLVLDKTEKTLYVAVTRANAVWRLPFAPDGTVVRMGVQIQLSGGRRHRHRGAHRRAEAQRKLGPACRSRQPRRGERHHRHRGRGARRARRPCAVHGDDGQHDRQPASVSEDDRGSAARLRPGHQGSRRAFRAARQSGAAGEQ